MNRPFIRSFFFAAALLGAVFAAAQEPLPRAFRGISLGMGMDEVESLLKNDPLFFYRGEADVSLLPTKNQSLIEVPGQSYIKRAYFQFKEGRLFIMIFSMNTTMIDHYSIYSGMRSKYGEPAGLDPKEAFWTDGGVRISIERPLSVKYIDSVAFEKIKSEGVSRESFEAILRKDFIEQF